MPPPPRAIPPAPPIPRRSRTWRGLRRAPGLKTMAGALATGSAAGVAAVRRGHVDQFSDMAASLTVADRESQSGGAASPCSPLAGWGWHHRSMSGSLEAALGHVRGWGAEQATVAVVGSDGIEASVGDPVAPAGWASVTKLVTAYAVLRAIERRDDCPRRAARAAGSDGSPPARPRLGARTGGRRADQRAGADADLFERRLRPPGRPARGTIRAAVRDGPRGRCPEAARDDRDPARRARRRPACAARSTTSRASAVNCCALR